MEWRWPSNVVHHCGAEEGSNPYGRKKVVKGHMAVSPKPSPGQRLGGTPLRTVLGSQFGEFFPIGRTWDENLVLSFENHEGSGLQLRHAVPPPRGLVDPWWILNIAMGHKCLISRFGGSCRGAPSLRVRVFSLHARPNPWPWNDRSGGKKNTGGNLQNTVFFFFFCFTFSIDVLHCYIVEVVLVISICKRGWRWRDGHFFLLRDCACDQAPRPSVPSVNPSFSVRNRNTAILLFSMWDSLGFSLMLEFEVEKGAGKHLSRGNPLVDVVNENEKNEKNENEKKNDKWSGIHESLKARRHDGTICTMIRETSSLVVGRWSTWIPTWGPHFLHCQDRVTWTLTIFKIAGSDFVQTWKWSQTFCLPRLVSKQNCT